MWTAILAASTSGEASQAALEDLCASYYRPVEFFIKRWLEQNPTRFGGRNSLEAGDLTQSFFVELLSGKLLNQVDRTKGKFRTYLLASVKHFLADQFSSFKTIKRGEGKSPSSLDTEVADSSQGLPADAYFDRGWAIAIVDRCVSQLQVEYLGSQPSDCELRRFQLLKETLVAPILPANMESLLNSVQWNDNAYRVALHRMRKRFRQVVVDTVLETLSEPSEIDSEIGYLLQALANG
jgi:DNA-directed RNA polymerase specialized sigma24 family protein